jgi:hypothetical protein
VASYEKCRENREGARVAKLIYQVFLPKVFHEDQNRQQWQDAGLKAPATAGRPELHLDLKQSDLDWFDSHLLRLSPLYSA